MVPISNFVSQVTMSSSTRLLLLTVVSSLFFTATGGQHSDSQSLPQTGLVDSVSSAVEKFFFVPPEHEHEGEIEKGREISPDTALAVVNSTSSNNTDVEDEHTRINRELAEDEERVLAKGEVKVRKKRTFCKSCYPTMSYGYGGGGGCCGACGQCGGGYRQTYAKPIRIKVKIRPIYYGGGGYGGGSCCQQQQNPCNVCGRK